MANILIVVAGVTIGLIGARIVLNKRGGRPGEWSWRDGGVDPDL